MILGNGCSTVGELKKTKQVPGQYIELNSWLADYTCHCTMYQTENGCVVLAQSMVRLQLTVKPGGGASNAKKFTQAAEDKLMHNAFMLLILESSHHVRIMPFALIGNVMLHVVVHMIFLNTQIC